MKCSRLTLSKHKDKSQDARGFLWSLLPCLPPISASLTRTDEIPWLLKPVADLPAISAEARFSPALRIHFSTRSAMQASTQGCRTTALGAGSNGEQAERKAVSLKEVGSRSTRRGILLPIFCRSSNNPLLCDFWGVGGSRSSSTAICSTSAVGSHPLGSMLPREHQQMNRLLIRASILTASSLVKHAENVTSSATRPIEPFLRSLSNFLSYFNTRRQAHRQNSSSHTSGNSSSRNTY